MELAYSRRIIRRDVLQPISRTLVSLNRVDQGNKGVGSEIRRAHSSQCSTGQRLNHIYGGRQFSLAQSHSKQWQVSLPSRKCPS